MTNKTIGGCIRTPCPDVFCRYNDWIKNLCGLRSRVHPFGNYVEHQEHEVSTTSIATLNANSQIFNFFLTILCRKSVNIFYFYFWKLLLIYFILLYWSFIFGKCPIENYFFIFLYFILFYYCYIFGKSPIGIVLMESHSFYK